MQLERRNLEIDYYVDMILNTGFRIEREDPFAPVNIDTLINSQRYFDTEFSCDCGAFIGKDLVGKICPRCKSEISLKPINFEYTGWVDLENHKVITPIYYEKIKRIIGGNMLKYILGNYRADNRVKYTENDKSLENEKKKKRTGKVAAADLSTIKNKIPKNKYYLEGIGHDKFAENFEEIFLACVPPSHRDDEEVKIVLEEQANIFTSKIPIYSVAFRPVTKTSETMFYPKVNKWFSGIVSNNVRLPSMHLDFEIRQALNDIQTKWVEAAEYELTNEMSKKTGFIRSEIIGGPFSFSARAVITLAPYIRGNEVMLPYTLFVTGYQFKITHIMAMRYDMTLERAFIFVNHHQDDPRVQEIANEILVNEQPKIVILREPVNNFGSIELCDIKGLKMDDCTISMTIEPLDMMTADFDGDQLNLMFVDKEAQQIFKQFKFSYMKDYINGNIQYSLREWADVSFADISS